MSVRSYFKRLVIRRKKPKLSVSGGFTLIELLVSIIVGGILITGLMAVIIDFLKVDQREIVLEQTQRDMDRALNYIADDMREAVYVYSNPGIITPRLTATDLIPAGTTRTPVLAFWRPDPIETGLPPNCTALPADKVDECEVLKLRQAAYSLVVYLLQDDDPNDDTWVGPSQIVRYELDKYSNSVNLTRSSGYDEDPTGVASSFVDWRLGATTNTDGVNAVLVDLVDDPTATLNKSPLDDATAPCKDSYGANYEVVPPTATTGSSTSFFACVRDPASGVVGDTGSGNQDVYVFLRGNISNRVNRTLELGALRNSDSAQPTLETQVLVRGLIEKNLD